MRVTSIRPFALRSVTLQACRSVRCLSSTIPRAPTSTLSDPRGGEPVNDIDVVFDYPSEAQGSMSHNPPSLESAGLGAGMYGGKYTGKGIDEAMGSMKGSMGGIGRVGSSMKEPMKKIDKEMGYPNNNVIYAGLGALGLAALYMKLRQPGQREKTHGWDANIDARRSSTRTFGK